MDTTTTCPSPPLASVGGGAALLRPLGELDLATVARFEAELAEAAARDPRSITVDLRGLEFMDSSGLHALLAARRRALDEGRALELVPGPLAVHRVFTATGTDRLFTFVDADGSPPTAAS